MSRTVRIQAVANSKVAGAIRMAQPASLQHAALRILAALLSIALVTFATDAIAKSKKPRAIDHTRVIDHTTDRPIGFADLIQISTPPSPAPATSPATPAPVRFFTIQGVLNKIDANGGIPTARFAALSTPTATDANTGINIAPTAPAMPEVTGEPFRLTSFRAPDGELWVKWHAVQETIAQDIKTLATCRADRDACGSDAATRFLAVMDEAQAKPDASARIETVNRLVNSSIRYTTDMAQWGVADRWSAPLETFATGKGDCEDYAIAKYVALREIGFDPSDLKVLLVKDMQLYQDHAVLAVRQEGRWLILDNRWSLVVEDNEVRSLVALYALDHEGVKLFAAPYAARGTLPTVASMAPAVSGPAAQQADSDAKGDLGLALFTLPLPM